MSNDPAIDEIRRVRHEISHDVGHDLRKLKKTFKQIESQFERPPVDYGHRRTIASSGAVKTPEK